MPKLIFVVQIISLQERQMTKSTASAQALRTPDVTGSIRMECLTNFSDLVRVGVWVSPPLSLTPEQMSTLQEETDCFLRRLWMDLSDPDSAYLG